MTTESTERQAAAPSIVKVANGSTPSQVSRPKERSRSQTEPLKAVNVKGASSIRLEDISNPQLESSTHEALSSRGDVEGTKLQPTRVAPAPPRVAPAPPRPPLPQLPADRPLTLTATHHDEIVLRSPSGPPPAPPDSRHRFYSTQTPPRRPAAPSGQAPDRSDSVATSGVVSSIRSKFEPAESGHSSSANTTSQRQHVARHSPAAIVNESQC